MIAVTTENGATLRFIQDGGRYGFHRLFGFVSETSARERLHNRERHGLSRLRDEWLCRFDVDIGEEGWVLAHPENCQVTAISADEWRLSTSSGNFRLQLEGKHDPQRLGVRVAQPDKRKWIAIPMAMLPFLLLFLAPRPEKVAPQEISEPIAVHVPEAHRAVRIPVPTAMEIPKLESRTQNKEKAGGAKVAQNLGFLSILGKKDLTKAIGGAPTDPSASAGAGAGGNKGSGGELLAGLGQGVKQTTVGNTGVQGLGGVGKSGAGGGAGGYGNSDVGSGGMGNGLKGIGDGRSLASAALSKDIVLEGGLDRSVIQATIAKYLSQVRACYEEGLRKTPGLSGQVTMKFEIGGEGRLNSAQVGKSSLGDANVEQCIATRMMNWQFPKPLGGVNVKVAYPFLLRPVNS